MKSKVELTRYDQISSKYIEHVNRNNSWNNLYERPYMLSLFDDFSNKTVLDLGCGTGFYSLYALEQKASSVTSVDASQEMLNHVKGKDASGRIKLVNADLTQGLPFIQNASQEYIICSLVLHYLEHWDGLVSEFYRVLKPGGKVYISTHHPFGDFLVHNKESYFDTYLIRDTWGDGDNSFPVNYYTRTLEDLLKPFLNSGLRIVSITEPQVSEDFKHLNEKAFKYLSKNPAFLFLVLEK